MQGVFLIRLFRRITDLISTSSISSSRDHNPATPKIARSRHQDLRSERSSDTDYRGGRSPQRYPTTVPRLRHGRSDTERRGSHHLEPRVEVPRFGGPRVDPHVGGHHSEPCVDPYRSGPRGGSHHMEARIVNRHFPDIRHKSGRDTQSGYSAPPSPTPSPRTIPHQLLTPPAHQRLAAPVIGQSRSHPPAEIGEPALVIANPLDLRDIYHLDAAYVQLRDPDCVKAIHTPPRGERGPLGRWYIVTIGKSVGVFNDW